jgi:CBS domain containing-hemolysin-like protein
VNNDSTIFLISLLILLSLEILTVAARAALANINLAHFVSSNGKTGTQAQQVLHLLNPEYVLRPQSALHLALSLLRFAIAGFALALTWMQGLLTNLWYGAAVLLVVALTISWLEWTTAFLVSRNPEAWAVNLAGYTQVISVFLLPLTFLTTRWLDQGHNNDTNANTVTEDELKSMVDASQQEGVLEQEERKMIYSIFRLGDTLAREIMIPRIDITALDITTPIDQAIEELLKSGFSRVPVYEESIDNVLGLLYTKDLLRLWQENIPQKSLRDLLRPAYFVPEAKKVDEMLAEMQSQRVHMAIIVDEYGGVAGLLTLEDIVEEIVGEIQDEFDQTEELPYQEVNENEVVFQGRIDLDHFNDVMGSNIQDEDAETLGGFIYNQIGRVPLAGESIQVGNLRLSVEQVLGRRIRKVRAETIPSDDGLVEDEAQQENRDAEK